MNHSIRMILIELVLLSIIPIVHTMMGRCYLCSEETLPQCTGSNQLDSSIYNDVLQYYTEPCNGQCVLFRNENHWIIRGCSWTYGHMTTKSIGWHEISPDVKAYFCDSHLCNNGTYERPEKAKIRTEFHLLPQQLFLLAGNNPVQLQFGGFLPRQLRQCYSCTARFQGCGEFLNPHYASKYIRSCSTSCIIFRNPNDLNLITRDCSLFWPQVHAKSGLHKLLGTDAYFCQESLCNGISFDFIMGILHNQLSAVITFPPIRVTESTTRSESTTFAIVTNSTEQIAFLNDDDLSDNPENSTWISLNVTDTSPFISSTITVPLEEDEWMSMNASELVTAYEHLSVELSTPMIDLLSLMPYYFLPNQTKTELFEDIQPLVIPPFSWMLSMAAQNESQFSDSTTTTTTTTTTTEIVQTSYDYCENQQCHHGGRLTSDCFCICLPAFTGENCETVSCDDEPPDICAFILEHECPANNIRYLCPKFCQLDICLSQQR